jgi:hypothetical protein
MGRTLGQRSQAALDQRRRVGAHLAASDEPLSFGKDIKPLFRERDRQSMTFAFDLWSHDDVARNSGAILGRLREGTASPGAVWKTSRTHTRTLMNAKADSLLTVRWRDRRLGQHRGID